MNIKEVAGVYAYMTGKGQSPERASVLMNNMFSMLGRGEVVEKLKKAGVNVFDNGKIRSTLDIFKDMSVVMSKMNDQEKSNFVENIGVVDKEAKSSFMVMTSDVNKLQSSLNEVANSAGETDKALALSANSSQRWGELINSFKSKLILAGTSALPIFSAGITLLGGTLDVVCGIIGGATSFIGGWYDMLSDGNPLIWGLTAALGAAGVMLSAHKVKLMAVSLWNGLTAATTGVLGRALTALKATMLTSPIGLMMLGVSALAGAMIAFGTKTDKVTKSFAAFNSELAKSKAETSDGFAVAMQAAENTEERKEAIRKLNEQYGQYLPNMLDEKANNVELAAALSTVNVELERKLLNKFRDQALESAMSAANEAKTEILNWMLDEVDVGQQKQLAADFNTSWGRMMTGQSDWRKEQKFYEDKYDLDANFLSDIYNGGINPFVDGVTWNAVGGKMMDLQNAAHSLHTQQQRIDLLYNSSAMPASQVTNNISYNSITPIPYLQGAGQGLPGFDLPAAGAMQSITPAATTTATNTKTKPGQPDAATLRSMLNNDKGGNGGGGGGGSRNVFDLDQQVINAKGSTSYNAITSKLGKVKMASLAAAALSGVAMTSPALTVPDISDGVTTQMTSKNSDFEDYGNPNRPKTLNLDKFCDQIVIHIAKADNNGYDEIRRRVMEVLKEVTDEQG